MKRKTEPVPEFDEIIFENRNKEYGAYMIRKYYKSTTSFSILGGTILFSAIILLLAMNSEKGIAVVSPVIGEVIEFKPVNIPQPQQENKPPEGMKEILKNVAPVVVTDSALKISNLATFGELVDGEVNKPVNDSALFTQTIEPIVPAEPEIFYKVEEMPEFPGGETELLRFVGQNIIYPEEAKNVNLQGRVIIQFVVNTDGSVDRAKILKGIDESLDNEALRVVNLLPKFKPGKQNGVPVQVWYVIPIMFKLEN
jgi:periplasmic protein TonB